MKTRMLLVAAAVALYGCGSVKKAFTTPQASTQVAGEPGAPSPKPGLDWSFTPAGPNAALVYGAASGSPSLMMACAARSGSVSIGQLAPGVQDAPAAALTLVSGTVKSTSVATVQPWPGDASRTVASARFSTLDPIVQSFAHHRWIGVQAAGADKPDSYVEQPGTTAIAQFLAFCG